MIKKYIAFTALLFLSCSTTVNVEYPVFPNNKQGRKLKKFLGKIKNVGIVIEKPKENWITIFKDQTIIEQVPAQVFSAFSKESYYKLIDISKRKDLTEEITFSLTGITQNRLKLGKLLSAEAILYVSSKTPYYDCNVEMRTDYTAVAMKVLNAYLQTQQGNKQQNTKEKPVSKPTGVISMLIPLDVTLVKVETGELLKSDATKVYKHYNSVGLVWCPSPITAFSKALNFSVEQVKNDLSPKVKTAKIKIFKKYKPNIEVEHLLKEGYLEITGENPSYKRAFENWKEADKLAKGKSWEALTNIGTYYFSLGDFNQAIEYYNRSMKIRSNKKRNYIREIRKKAEANNEVSETTD